MGLRVTTVDGNDVEAVARAADEMVDRIRAGGGPEFLHARTYRQTGHTSFDQAAYRPKGEAERHKAEDDPITRQRETLVGMGLDLAKLETIHAEAQAEMAALLQEAAATPFPSDNTAFTDIQDIGSPAKEAF